MTIPRRILENSSDLKGAALGNLAHALPDDTTLYLLTDDPASPPFTSWLANIDRAHPPILIGADDDVPLLESEMWSQDPWLITKNDGAEQLHELRHTDRPGRLAHVFSSFRNIDRTSPDIHLAGGNTLTGPNFRLLGALSVELTRRVGTVPISAEEALARHQAMDARPIHIFGFALPGRANAAVELRQQPHHLDLVVSLTGVDTVDGRPILFVADPRKTFDPDGPRMEGWAEQLDASAARLGADGFAVRRNPVPYVAHPRFSPNPNLRAYNNVIVENAVRTWQGKTRPLVWVPQFGDLEPELDPYDRANRLAWEALGFEIAPVLGWSALVRAGGAIRCASKVLTRR